MSAASTVKLSGAVMTKDSMATIEACLASLRFCDEIVVVDDHSTDGTWEWLQQAGDKVRAFQRRLDTFVEHRRQLFAATRGQWVLIVDADEEALGGLGEEIRSLLAGNPACDAYFLPLKNVLPEHWPREVFFWTSQKRLLRKGAVWWEDSTWIHVPALHAGSAGRLRHGVKHRVYDSMMHMVRKQVSYGQSGAEHFYKKNKRTGLWSLLQHTLAAFFKFYVGKGLFRQGLGGFAVAFSKAFYVFVKYAALWELNATGGVQPQERRRVPGDGAQTPSTE